MVKAGLEIHASLNTLSKLFCSCSNSSSDEPNSLTCPVCLGMPGSKPSLNVEAFKKGLLVSLALNCSVLDETFFSRKVYFYPDMSKNYQITQYENPLSSDGFLAVGSKKIRIKRVHLEEDPAQLVHVGGDITNAKYCLVDYNRAGIPLLEIVTEPDFSSGEEAEMFLLKLKSIFEHLGITPVFKIDVNVSIPGHSRVEIKNVTGIKVVRKAIDYEAWRQEGRADEGEHTRALKLKPLTTDFLRSKESEDEYGYIFEPDLPVFRTKELLKEIILPELPDFRVERFVREYGIEKSKGEVIIFKGKFFADFFERCAKQYKEFGNLANWLTTFLIKILNYNSISLEDTSISAEQFVDLLSKIDSKKITSTQGKEFLKTEEFISGKKIVVKNVEIDLESVVNAVLKDNKDAVSKYLSGKKSILEFLVGQVMRKTGKSADPNIVREFVAAKIIKESGGHN